jgi:ankyrin repeat protein
MRNRGRTDQEERYTVYFSVDEKDKYPLHYSIVFNDVQSFQTLISQLNNSDNNNKTDYINTIMKCGSRLVTPLHLAVCLNRETMCEELLKSGANVNAIATKNPQPTYSTTVTLSPLYLAVRHSSIKVIKLLIQYGANLNLEKVSLGEYYDGEYCNATTTPLISAIKRRVPDIVKLLVENGANINAISSETFEEYTNSVEYKIPVIAHCSDKKHYDISFFSADNSSELKLISRILIDAGVTLDVPAICVITGDNINDRYLPLDPQFCNNVYLRWYATVGQYWKQIRLLWIGHLSQSDSFFSRLPSDVIHVIASFIVGTFEYRQTLNDELYRFNNPIHEWNSFRRSRRASLSSISDNDYDNQQQEDSDDT